MRRREDPPLDRATVDGIIRMLMDVDAKLDRVLDLLEDSNGEEDES